MLAQAAKKVILTVRTMTSRELKRCAKSYSADSATKLMTARKE